MVEANSHSASREVPNLLWELKVHYCVHKSHPVLSKRSRKVTYDVLSIVSCYSATLGPRGRGGDASFKDVTGPLAQTLHIYFGHLSS